MTLRRSSALALILLACSALAPSAHAWTSHERPARATPGRSIAAEQAAFCADLALVPEVELGGVRPDFEHNTKYSVEVPSTEIKDQCQSRSCWIFSGVSNIEQRVLTNTGKKVDLSEEYLIIQSIRTKVLEALDNPGEQFAPGGSAGNVDWLVETFGILPSAAWRPRVDFKPEAISRRMYYFINARLAKFHLEIAAADNDFQRLGITETAKADLLKLIESYSGPLPASFEFEGKRYESPQDYAAHSLPPEPRPTIQYSPPDMKLPDSLKAILKGTGRNGPTAHIAPHYTGKELPLEQIAEKIKSALARGESVRLSYESVHEFIDEKTGIASVGAFFIPKGFEPPPRGYRQHFDFKGVGHAVEIVGADVGPDGQIIKLKIKNSHGVEAGDAGYLHMYWDYFKAFMSSVYIREPAE